MTSPTTGMDVLSFEEGSPQRLEGSACTSTKSSSALLDVIMRNLSRPGFRVVVARHGRLPWRLLARSRNINKFGLITFNLWELGYQTVRDTD